ncbi:Cell wall-associated hydrolase, NlpC family [Actinacidiphila yanglinensis]|uniref:Cell wall-associated hydrolase, NlpC family n=1 Tax=Actinacidiphila yanglinensis TaxID=310779 RepID=A0A1H5VL62_9ACTN|nr:NlpC/P60 family protein [Actinacidiphila yanglinensis]SEF87571.1 Cell wall-associated hydrolase, NlpC family [Actinacidiphila yanglinensis]
MSVARQPSTWFRSAVVCGTLLATAALSLPAAQSAAAQPHQPADPPVPLSTLLTRLQTYYQQTETATEAYNKAKETADQQRARARKIDQQLAAQKTAVEGSRAQLGLMATQMYRNGGMSPYLSLLSGQSPQDFFGGRHVIGQLAKQQQSVLGQLTKGETRLKRLNTQAQKALDTAEHAQTVAGTKKKSVQAHLDQVESMLAGLTGVQIAALQKLEQTDTDKAQQELMDSKALGDDPALRAPSLAGDRAIGYAFDQLGKPYVWGAQGPDSFDCSGLTSQAWAHAGTVIPRTSEDQWAKLPHVPLALLRPGDLVIYFKGASHVALYIGDGLTIQAPRPGSYVRVEPIAANPILGAVRPDLGKQPLSGYQPRSIPKGAEQPTPIGVKTKAPAPKKTAKDAKNPKSAAKPAETTKPTKPAKPAKPTAPTAPATPTTTATPTK